MKVRNAFITKEKDLFLVVYMEKGSHIKGKRFKTFHKAKSFILYKEV